jgi:hypothetical protein
MSEEKSSAESTNTPANVYIPGASLSEPLPIGIGGWLLLVGLGLIIGPIRLLFSYKDIYSGISEPGLWDSVTNPTSELYLAGFFEYFVTSTAINVLMLGASIALLVLFLKESRLFPRWYIAVSIAGLVIGVADAYFASVVVPSQPMVNVETMREIVRSLISVLVWCPYMLMSLRVKNTFIK